MRHAKKALQKVGLKMPCKKYRSSRKNKAILEHVSYSLVMLHVFAFKHALSHGQSCCTTHCICALVTITTTNFSTLVVAIALVLLAIVVVAT